MSDDLVEVLSQLGEVDGNDGYLTTRELMARFGCCKNKMLDKLNQLNRLGQLETAMVRRVNLTGKAYTVPGYRIKK
jgi:hypothetical protein